MASEVNHVFGVFCKEFPMTKIKIRSSWGLMGHEVLIAQPGVSCWLPVPSSYCRQPFIPPVYVLWDGIKLHFGVSLSTAITANSTTYSWHLSYNVNFRSVADFPPTPLVLVTWQRCSLWSECCGRTQIWRCGNTVTSCGNGEWDYEGKTELGS